MAEPRDEDGKRAFSALQPLCVLLLELPTWPAHRDPHSLVFEPLAKLLRALSLPGLQLCMDYVLYPLQLLLDAAVICRTSTASSSANAEESRQSKVQSRLPISDKVAEGVLLCLKELLQRCSVTDISQMNLLWKELSAAIMLSPKEASEEFRHGAVKCLNAMLLALNPCGRSTCVCALNTLPATVVLHQGSFKPSLGFPTDGTDVTEGDIPEERAELNGECVVEFLRSECMSAAVGHLLSLFLQIADQEAQRGSLGSANLRIDALSTLRVLLLKVGTADALSFFLPGVVSGLVKVICSARMVNKQSTQPSYPTGAAGSSGAVEEGLRGIAELLMLVLADTRNLHIEKELGQIMHLANVRTKDSSLIEEHFESAESALAALYERSNHLGLEDREQATLDSSLKLNEVHIPKTSEELNSDRRHSPGNLEGVASFQVERNQEWLRHTASRVNDLLSHSLVPICSHPAQSVRLALAESAAMLLLTCGHTLKVSRSTFLECLLALSCDDWPCVASAAHLYLEFLLSQTPQAKGHLMGIQDDIKHVLNRLIERLPIAVFSADEQGTLRLSHQVAAAMFFAQPDGVSQCLFHSPAAACRFITVMTQCLNFDSAFAGSMKNLTFAGPDTLGYVQGISELIISKEVEVKNRKIFSVDPVNVSCKGNQSLPSDQTLQSSRASSEDQQLPRVPPWLARTGRRKLFQAFSSILRFAGLSTLLGCGDGMLLFVLVEALLPSLRQLSIKVGTMEDDKGIVTDWYTLLEGGKLSRSAATAAFLLNEIVYGASGCWLDKLMSLFGGLKCLDSKEVATMPTTSNAKQMPEMATILCWNHVKDCKGHVLIECIGDILHDYMSIKIWELPLDATCFSVSQASSDAFAGSHIFQDNSALQQVILEGIGIFSISVGKLFEDNGFLASSLYLLLEKLGCSNFQVSSSADLALSAIQAHCGYPSVKSLVMANADYIIDSLCRQLRHLPLYPNAPDMLVAVLRYTGAACDLLPLLEEPMRNISLELEIPARQQHPSNTIPLLKALREIAKAARCECSSVMSNTSKLADLYDTFAEKGNCKDQEVIDRAAEDVIRLKERKRHRQSIEAVIVACLNVCTPLLAAKDQQICLSALDIAKDGISALSIMDLVARNENEDRETINKALNCHDDISDLDASEPPKLLPAMHRIWPHLVVCLKKSQPSVVDKSLKVIASVIFDCGGDFFIRRFQKDAVPHMCRLLYSTADSGLLGLRQMSSDVMTIYNKPASFSANKHLSSASLFKLQRAALSCITEIAKDKKSSSALVGVVCPLAATAVALVCGVPGLEESATEALIALSHIDSDLVWIMVADLVYGNPSSLPRNICVPGLNFPEVSEILPALVSSKEALWKQAVAEEYNLSIDSSKAWDLLTRLESCK